MPSAALRGARGRGFVSKDTSTGHLRGGAAGCTWHVGPRRRIQDGTPRGENCEGDVHLSGARTPRGCSSEIRASAARRAAGAHHEAHSTDAGHEDQVPYQVATVIRVSGECRPANLSPASDSRARTSMGTRSCPRRRRRRKRRAVSSCGALARSHGGLAGAGAVDSDHRKRPTALHAPGMTKSSLARRSLRPAHRRAGMPIDNET